MSEEQQVVVDPLEVRAKNMGWAPKDSWKGDPERWIDAKTFVDKAEESLPILKERNKKLQSQLEDTNKTIQEFKKYHDTVEERAYERAKKELEIVIKTAAKDGDEEVAVKAAKELADLENNKTPKTPINLPDPVFEEWISENGWYKDDPELTIEAEAAASSIRYKEQKLNKKPMLGKEFLDLVKKEVKERFPHKFSNPRKNATQTVENSSVGGGNSGGNGSKSFGDLPKEAKDAFDKFAKKGLYDSNAVGKEKYAKRYWEQA